MALNRDQIFAANDRPLKEVPCPEWGGSVYVRVFSARQRAAVLKLIHAASDQPVDDAAFVVMAAVDENGEPIFTEDDIERLASEKNPEVVLRVAAEGLRFNGLLAEGDREAGNVSETSQS